MTPYGAPLLLAIVVLVVALAVMVSLRRVSRREARRRGDDPAPIMLHGRGASATKLLDFRAGQYRLDYRFSDEWPTAVYLVSATTGDKDLLLYKTGAGSLLFTVEADGRAVVEVEPTADRVDWQLEIRTFRRLPTA